MNYSEEQAASWLRRQFADVQYEPEGASMPPDFVCDGQIAVEVRMLNIVHRVDSRELESEQHAAMDIFEQLVAEVFDAFSDRLNGTYVAEVLLGVDRTITSKTKKEWKHQLSLKLNELISSGVLLDQKLIELDHGVTLRISELHGASSTFRVINVTDDLASGFLIDEYPRSIEYCIREKTKSLQKYGDKYKHHWLILVDHVKGYDPSYEPHGADIQKISSILHRPEEWDRIVVLKQGSQAVLWDI
jgi:hypothetical protein